MRAIGNHLGKAEEWRELRVLGRCGASRRRGTQEGQTGKLCAVVQLPLWDLDFGLIKSSFKNLL